MNEIHLASNSCTGFHLFENSRSLKQRRAF
jgi:hypothetical protein